jgi:hypothetical protein
MVVTRFLGTVGPSDSWPSPRSTGVFGSPSLAGHVSRVANFTVCLRATPHYPGGMSSDASPNFSVDTWVSWRRYCA